MKPYRDITLRFIFLVTVLFCYWQNTIPMDDVIPVYVEIAEGNCQHHESILSHSDSSTEDQLTDHEENGLTADELKSFPASREISLFPFPPLPIWQPPRV